MNPEQKNSGLSPTDAAVPLKCRAVFWVCVVLAAITLAVFGQTWRHEFVNFDDDFYVYENSEVSSGLTSKGIADAFNYHHSDNWIPLTILSHTVDCQLYGLKAGGHHLTNVALHIAAVIFLFLALRRMTGALWRPAFVAGVFAIHPLHVESVAWIAERKDVLSGLFFMLTLWAYQKNAECRMQNAESKEWKWVVLVFFTLGLMSKPMLVTLPFVLLLLDYWPLKRSEEWKRLVVEKWPLFGLVVASCVLTVFAQSRSHAISSLESYSIPSRIGNALVSYVTYIGQMFYPSGLAAFYPRPISGHPLWETITAFLFLAGVSLVVIVWRRKHPYLIVGWLWYLGMLVPVSGVLQAGEQAHADRYTYLPQIGLYIMLAWGAAELSAGWRYRRAVLGCAATLVIGALGFCAYLQTSYWKNSESLWNHALSCTSNNDRAHYNLGTWLLKNERLNEAVAHLRKSLEIAPDDPEAYYDLGAIFLHKGELDEAMAQFIKAVKLTPGDFRIHRNLGEVLVQKGLVNEAIGQFQKAMELMPDDPRAHYGLGEAFLEKGQLDGAMAQFQKTAELTPDDPRVQYNLGIIFQRKDNTNEAIARFRKAIEIKPDYAHARSKLADLLLQKGLVDEAIAQFQKTVELTPNDPRAECNLGDALLQKGNVAAAALHYQKVFEIGTDFVSTHASIQDNLAYIAWVLATSSDSSIRNGSKAIEIAQRTDQLSGGTNAMVIGALAAGYAETGRFSDAVATARRALQQADNQNNTELSATLQKQIKSYQEGAPFRETAPP